MSIKFALAFGTACSISLIFLAAAQPAAAVDEVEPNYTFATRQFLPPGTTTVNGTIYGITPPVSDLHTSGTLSAGHVNTVTFKGLSPSKPFVAFTENIDGSVVDTILGIYNESGSLIKSDDDSGRGGFSALSGSVNRDGTIRLAVTGYPDPHFVGHHLLSGEHYQLFIKLGTSILPPLKKPHRDLDFYTFSNLIPGNQYTVKVTSGTLFPFLGWLDDSQKQLGYDFENGKIYSAQLNVTVPKSGHLNFATGSFYGNGRYTLSLTPAPKLSSELNILPFSALGLALLTFSFLGAAALLKRKK